MLADQVGHPGEDLARVFEPFDCTPQARRDGRGGVGFGLAVARRIVASFEGSLTPESAIGRGSRFTLLLPEAAQKRSTQEVLRKGRCAVRPLEKPVRTTNSTD